MDDIERAAVEGTEVRAPAAPGRERRMTAGRKREAVLRLVRGEPLELVAPRAVGDGGRTSARGATRSSMRARRA